MLNRAHRRGLIMVLAVGLLACDPGEAEVVEAAENLCADVEAAGDSQRALDEGLADAERAGHFRAAVLEEMEGRCPEVVQGLDHGDDETSEALADFDVIIDECRQHRANGTVRNDSSETRDVRIVVEFVAADDARLSRVRAEVRDLAPGGLDHWEVRSGVRAGAEDCVASVEGVR